MKLVTLFFLLTFFYLPSLCQAQTVAPKPAMSHHDQIALDELPASFQKRWTLMNCQTGELYYRFSKNFVLTTIEKGAQLVRLQDIRQEPSGYLIIPALGESYRFFIGQNGDLVQLFNSGAKSVSAESIEKKSAFIPHIYYKDCGGQQAGSLQEDTKLKDMMAAFDDIHKACPEVNSISLMSCQQALFGLFDKDNDQALSEAEASQAWEFISPHSNIRNNCSRVETTPLEQLLDFGPYHQWLLAEADSNHDRAISLPEIAGVWNLMRADPLMNTFVNVVETAQSPLTIIPASEVPPSTNICAGSKTQNIP